MTAFIDGQALAQEIQQQLVQHVRALSRSPRLGIIIVGDNPVTESFVRTKKRFADAVGVEWIERRFPKTATTAELVESVEELTLISDGIVVQLPLPLHIDTTAVLRTIPTVKDVDVLSDAAFEAFRSGKHTGVPPVAGAIVRMLEAHNVPLRGTPVTIIGKGRLVGLPTKILLERMGAEVRVIDTRTSEALRAQFLKEGHVIISGVGIPGLVQPHMVSDDAILIDAGTSSTSGNVVGDIAPECFEHASLVSKTPGGVGPVTVAMLFQNLIGATLN